MVTAAPPRTAPASALARRVFAANDTRRRMMCGLLTAGIVSAVLATASPLLTGRIVDALGHHAAPRTVVGLAVAVAVAGVAESGCDLISRTLSATIGEGLVLELRTELFDHLLRMPVSFYTETRTGALVSRLNTDVVTAQWAFVGTLSGAIFNIVTLVLILTVMAVISWPVTLLALLMAPVLVATTRQIMPRLRNLYHEAAELNADLGSHMTERFSAGGATLLKLFGRPEQESRQFTRRAEQVRRVAVRIGITQARFTVGLTTLSSLTIALVYGVGGYLAASGHLAPGAIVSLALLMMRLYPPLTSLTTARVDLTSALVSFERIFALLDLVPAITDKPGARQVPEGPVTVEFEDVRFGYPTRDSEAPADPEAAPADPAAVLNGVSLRAEPGEITALVGTSGAGKSTIAALVSRLYDTDEGTVRLSGIDVRDLSAASIRETVGVVPQDGHLFHDTIRANLLLARPDAGDDQLWQALTRARLRDTVLAMPEGLDTVVGDRGYRLSGGERQRLTIARLLLQQPRVVILDEATAALDAVNEAAVHAAIVEILRGRTALVIAHRMSTITAADQILVLHDGLVVERGRHHELIATGRHYTRLHKAG
ncbi:ABC transporter ATP-binding protein [Nocardia sp. alder85J]|uniref:ABC transporter ATP-binding protein n=1 Tax=Nocardia sp. alder85J TaxID=2862949 RepID=UPI001CD7B476|nr:ABC transporter ATP-binding protein [Nocardia sp. alder85J]MCX4090991.1 ABC transporter ATP-binding protein [Nocardia sp. alder85J]